MGMIRKPSCIFSFSFITKFLVAMLVVILPLCSVLKLMWQPKNFMYNFYAFDQDAFDVQVFGSSHSFCSVIPAVLYEQYGITSYDLGGVSQYMPMTYYYIKESIRKNKPKVAVIEVFALGSEDMESDHWKWLANINFRPMYPSINKIRGMLDSKTEFPLASFFNYPISHSSFKGLSPQDYQLTREYDKNLGYIGFDNVYEHEVWSIPSNEQLNDIVPISEEEENNLRKAIELCLENDVEPVLFIAPYPQLSADKIKEYNYINVIAQEYGIEFFESYRFLDEMGIDCSTDFCDDHGHFNYKGAEKFTKFFGKWFVNNVHTTLVDHRIDVKKSNKPDWDEVTGNWNATKIRCELDHTESQEDYLTVLENEKVPYIVFGADSDYEALLKDVLKDLSTKEKRNVLLQVGAKIDRAREDIDGESVVYLVYNKYDLQEISIRAFAVSEG